MSAPHLLPDLLHTNAPLPISISAVCQGHNTWLKKRAQLLWENSTRYVHARTYTPHALSNDYLVLIDAIPRAQSTVLFQLRTGHIPLNQHLHRIGSSPSPICFQCFEEEETPQHYLLKCPAYNRERFRLREQEGHLQIKRLLSNPKSIKHLLEYIRRTGRLRTT